MKIFNIADFLANLDSAGLAKTSHFKVVITRPGGGSAGDSIDLAFRCEASELPGRAIYTHDDMIWGIARKNPYGSSVQEITLTFICSEDYWEKNYFESWMDDIVGPYRNGDIHEDMYAIGYYKEIVGTVLIDCYSETGEITYTVELRDAYPIAIGNIQLHWHDGSQISRLPVQFNFRYYVNETETGS